MVDVEDMKPSDVAETLDITLAALKSRLHRARLHVRQRLAEATALPPASSGSERRIAP
jgi:DNA-directed RNA polymerase specialized sigma24 family protein